MDETTPAEPATLPPTLEALPIEAQSEAHAPYQWVWAPSVFAVLTLGMFYDLLFAANRMVSFTTTDLAMQFVSWREFGFSQLRQGNLPLWNPHVFGGAPYFAGFQAALLYPLNWLHLFLPVGVAVNWITAIQVFLAGYFTYFWCRGRKVGIGGSILAGVMFMFCGPYFLHLYAGHLPHLAVMIWTPLMLLTIDKLADTGDWRWCLFGILVTSMHILAGHPQYLYYTGMTLSLYLLLRLFQSQHRLTLIGGFTVMYVGAILLTAVQLIPGLQATGEEVRSGGLPIGMAGTFSLPPQNFITFLVPAFFGNVPLSDKTPLFESYWGAGYLWEMSLFVSITGLVLAVLGACHAESHTKKIVLTTLAMTVLLGLGRHTPLYKLMYDNLPMYGSFRGTVKFFYLACLFIALLAGMGFDSLLKSRRVSWIFLGGLVLGAIWLAVYGARVSSMADQGVNGLWAEYIKSIIDTATKGEEWFWGPAYSPKDAAFVGPAGLHAAKLTYLAAGTLAGIALLVWASRFHRLVPYLLIMVACVEMFAFAHGTRATMDPADALAIPQAWQKDFASLPKDQRVLTVPIPQANLGMALGFDNLNGFDPGIFKRFAELFYAAQGYNPAAASQYLFPMPDRINLSTTAMRMLRCGLVCTSDLKPPILVKDPVPVAMVISDWVNGKSRDPILSYIIQGNFNPSNTVILESDPPIKTTPAAALPGKVSVLGQTTDTLELQADMDRPGILVVTNNYSTGWRVIPITAGQPDYTIMPANYTQIGIPLEKGSHHFILEYSPAAFRIGRWVSVFSLLGFIGAAFWLMRR